MGQLSKNFHEDEFRCKCCRALPKNGINGHLIRQLQELRDRLNKPIIIVSGYRCAKHNRAVGGARNSQHLYGKAADIVVTGMTPKQLLKEVDQFYWGGVGVYSTHVHVDCRQARW